MRMTRFSRPALVAALCVSALSAHAGHELLDRDVENGQALYADHCASCHGANLEGQENWRFPGPDGVLPAPPHDETGHTWHHDNVLLFDYTRLGGQGALAQRGITDFRSGMPAFEGTLTDEEIWEVLAYIRSTWPDRVQEMQAMRNPPH
ncbi:cytochrome c [Maritalea mobilis]|nr:cytochrome c [Maritalea mobilis]